MNDTEKIRVLLPHWIEHTRNHGQEFARWVRVLRGEGQVEAAQALQSASTILEDVAEKLREALALAGGSLNGTADQHHHHDHAHGHDGHHSHDH